MDCKDSEEEGVNLEFENGSEINDGVQNRLMKEHQPEAKQKSLPHLGEAGFSVVQYQYSSSLKKKSSLVG